MDVLSGPAGPSMDLELWTSPTGSGSAAGDRTSAARRVTDPFRWS